MAKYHENLTYHPDTLEKHRITKEEIDFLKELQKEMNTQDTVGQAAPRFWVIQGTEREYGIDKGYEDGTELVDNQSCDRIADTIEEVFEYIKDNLLKEINNKDGIQRIILLEEHEKFNSNRIVIKWIGESSNEECRVELDDLEEVCDWLNDWDYDYRCVNYKNKSHVYQDLMFLTQKSAEEHLRANHYHYSEDAHTYAMTAWRSPIVSKLFEILQTVDWDNL